MTWLEQTMATVAVIAAGLAGLIYMGRWGWRFLRAVQSVHELIHRELEPDSGSSMKDEVAAIAVHVGQLQADVRDLAIVKDRAHEVLQLQLDSIMHDLGTPDLTAPSHRRERETDGQGT